MYYSCMATKTITLELDAYEKLKNAKQSPRESFSSVIRRATFPDTPSSAAALLKILKKKMAEGTSPLNEEALNILNAAQQKPRVSESK